MPNSDFYKEYSRLRSIARKRIERASAAGLGEYVKLPTVKEVRASLFPEEYMQAVKTFLGEGGTLTSARKSGGRVEPKIPELDRYAKEASKPLSPEAKRARRNEQKRRSKAKRAVEKAAGSEPEARKKVGYLQALETVTEKWKEAGVDAANWLGVLSPGKAKSFVNYINYRLAQGDYKNRYAIDTFIKDFATLVEKGYNLDDIQHDFDVFLGHEKELKRNQRIANKYGIASDEIDSAWRKFVKQV